MTAYQKVNDVWTKTTPYIKNAGNWSIVNEAYIKNSGSWKQWYLGPAIKDRTFNSSIETGFNGEIDYITIQLDGKMLLCGGFTSYNGTSVGRIARLNSDGTLDTTFNTNVGTGFNDYVLKMIVQSDGKILIIGYFVSFNGTSVPGLVRLNSNGTLDTAFNTNIGPGFNDPVSAPPSDVGIQSDGKIVLVSQNIKFNGVSATGIVRLNSDGTLDTTFNTNAGTGFNYKAYRTVIQSDGKILVVGGFTSFNGTFVGRIVRLNSNGTLDTGFNTNIGDGFDQQVFRLHLQPDGKILVSGYFTYFQTTPSNSFTRLNSDGTLDTTFNTNIGTGFNNSYVEPAAFQSDGKIILGGDSTSFNGTSIGYIARLNSDGTLDTTFNSNAGTGFDGGVYGFFLQVNNILVVAGNFLNYNGISTKYICRLGLGI